MQPSSIPRSRRLLLLAFVAALLPLHALPAQQREGRPIGPGTRWERWVDPEGPWAIQIVEADLSESYLRIGPLYASDGLAGLAPLSEQALREMTPERYPIAAVNGDYFVMSGPHRGQPVNAVLRGGELLRSPWPTKPVVLLGPDAPRIASLRLDATVTGPGDRHHALGRVNHPRPHGQLVLYTPRYGTATGTDAAGVEVYLAPADPVLRLGEEVRCVVRAMQRQVGNAPIAEDGWVLSGTGAAAEFLVPLRPGDEVTLRVELDPPVGPEQEVIGGGPRLVREGRIVRDDEEWRNAGFARQRHPRTAVGLRGGRLLLITVDGRQPGHSEGMTLEELAQLMLALGCEEALNLDGGGSTTLWVRGRVLNRPSGGAERAITNGLAIFSTAPLGPPARLVVSPTRIAGLPGAALTLSVSAEDRHYNPVPLREETLRWEIDPDLGEIYADGRLLLAAEPPLPEGEPWVETRLRVIAGEAVAELPVRIYREPPRLELTPPVLRLLPGQQLPLTARAFDEEGRLLFIPDGLTDWRADPAVGSVDGHGLLTAAERPAVGFVTASIGETSASALATVGSVTRVLEDFSEGRPWRVSVAPEEARARAELTGERALAGGRSLAVTYDFTGSEATRAAYLHVDREIERPFALRVAVFGDGSRIWLRARVRDAGGMVHLLDFTRDLSWADEWRDVVALIPEEAQAPLTLEAVYLVEPRPERQVRGRILLDHLRAEYTPGR